MPGVPVSRRLERVGELMRLCLQPDLHDLHGTHDRDCLRRAGTKTRCIAAQIRISVNESIYKIVEAMFRVVSNGLNA